MGSFESNWTFLVPFLLPFPFLLQCLGSIEPSTEFEGTQSLGSSNPGSGFEGTQAVGSKEPSWIPTNPSLGSKTQLDSKEPSFHRWILRNPTAVAGFDGF
ncbi:hypothetical protein SLEP1_g59403 [Rubroshorea leprosula]|uniref:Uncharacterized protein n=1 Tax=Rubroshorea leprosula TaxID=152421 RepID=A0AAV5MSA1_9ROSI|nr:hypothetical protein SLEP1_g59403 [Rubroshorea leprosula]